MSTDAAGSIDDEFNRMLDSFSSLIDSQQRDLNRGMRVISQAFERAVQRFSDTLANTPDATAGIECQAGNSLSRPDRRHGGKPVRHLICEVQMAERGARSCRFATWTSCSTLPP